MAEKNPALKDSLLRLAAVPVQPPLTREQWIAKYARIELRSFVAVAPEAEVHTLDARWVLSRVGSFWRADEEYHVYALEHAVRAMIEVKLKRPEADMVTVTPVWVFKRSGTHSTNVTGEEFMRAAEQNFMRFFGKIYERYKTNG